MAARRLPVLVIAPVGAWLLVACGGTHHGATTGHGTAAAGIPVIARSDLRSPDVDARMDPASRGVFACPLARRVEVVFDPRGTVAVLSGGRPLVYGTVGTRAVNRACRAQGRLPGVPRGVLTGHYEAARVRCAVPGSARFEVHPITVAGSEVGSTVAVLEQSLRTIVLSAVLEPQGSRLYYGRSCHRGG